MIKKRNSVCFLPICKILSQSFNLEGNEFKIIILLDKLLFHTSGCGGLVFETLMHFCRFILIADIMGGFDMRGNRHHIFRSLSLSV